MKICENLRKFEYGLCNFVNIIFLPNLCSMIFSATSYFLYFIFCRIFYESFKFVTQGQVHAEFKSTYLEIFVEYS